MDLAKFLASSRPGEAIPAAAIGHVEAELTRGQSVADILRGEGLSVPAATVRQIADGWRELATWHRVSASLGERVPAELLDATVTGHGSVLAGQSQAASWAAAAESVDGLGRVVKNLPTERWPAGLDLWHRCFALALRDGVVRAPDGKHSIIELAPHRWLGLRHNESSTSPLVFELPLAACAEQAGVLGLDDAALRAVVLDEIERSVKRVLDRWAEQGAIRAAETTYVALLTAAPLDRLPAAAIAFGGQLGFAVLDSEGREQFAAQPKTITEAILLCEQQGVRSVVVPARAPEMDVLADAKTRLARVCPVTQVNPAGLSQARADLPGSAPVASALVLGRRAITPFVEWMRIDPVALGLVEYQSDLDDERVRTALMTTKEIARWERDRGGGTATIAQSTATIGPSVRSFREVKPGMMVQGVVTNVTTFGAFVSLGIPEEALVHVSELADRFVSSPNEVVRIGQTVLAKVLAVDAEKKRISLTLRREPRPPPKPDSPRGGGRATRTNALAALDKLFKK